MPFEAAPFGVTGLETAFAALYTHLVEPGLVRLETLLERMSAGPARIFGLPAPRIAVGAPANLVLLDSTAGWRVRGGPLPLALGELVAARPAAHREGAADGRGRPDGVRGMTGFLVLEDGTVFRGESRRRVRLRLRRGRVHDGDDRLPGGRHRPELRRADRLLHRADGRQLRRRRGSAPSRRASHARGVVMREARGPEWTDWLHERGDPGADRRRHAVARPHLREAGAMRAAVVSGEASVDETLRAVRQQPSMTGRRLAASVSVAEPVRVLRAADGPRRGRRLRLQALDPPPARDAGAGGHRVPARRRRRRARRLRRRRPLERPGRPRAADRARSRRCASCSAGSRSSASASATSCSRSPPASRPSSSRSATAARTTRCSSGRPAGCSSPRRTTASRSSRATDREATHVSLYDGTVEGLDYPELRARSVQFHPEAGPGPARRLAAPRALGRGGVAALPAA